MERHDITPVDRRLFPDLHFDERQAGDRDYRRRYRKSEETFLDLLGELSQGQGVAIFLDNIGGPVYRASTKALARQGVLATVGWKAGMRLWNLRASECIGRHLHVHTHVWRHGDTPRIRDYQERTGWVPPVDGEPVYSFDHIPDLATDFTSGLDTYFPLYEVNPL
jgi:NADPH:quinone reductase-like Zn-dependent oxidoreductase